MRAISPSRLIVLGFTTVIIFGTERKLCSYLQPALISFLFGSNLLPSTVLKCYQFTAIKSDINFHTNTKQVKTYERTSM
jgi:hypothetical protein